MVQNYSPSLDTESNCNRDSTNLSLQTLEAEILPTLASTNNNSHTEYPHVENGVPNFQVESSRTQLQAMDIETNYLSVELRNHGNSRKTEMIIELTKNHIHELMVDQFGNIFIQNLLQICNQSFINHLLFSLIKNEDLFVAVCLDNLGYRAVVKLIDRLKCSLQQSTIALVISCHVVTLAKSFNGGHKVLKCCFQRLSQRANELILLRIAQSCSEIVIDKAGCCILQVCIEYAMGEVRAVLMTPLIQDAENLSQHPYGNYVIQFIIQLDGSNIGAKIIKELETKFVRLSLNKYGSNVVEKCLSCCEDAHKIIFEIMENKDNWIQVCTDKYGNYVVQTTLSIAEGEVYNLLLKEIKSHWLALQFNPYGKCVIDATKRSLKKSKCN